MTIAQLLSSAQKQGLRTEMEIYLAHLLCVSRLDLLRDSDKEIPIKKMSAIQSAWLKILDAYPVAYLVKQKEFYGLNFYVDENVLVPRPETELLVKMVLDFANIILMNGKPSPKILELGTGSGAISVALKHEFPELELTATDISMVALEIAKKNAKKNKVKINFLESDLLKKVAEDEFDILVANLPYIGTETCNYIADNVRKYEPALALFGGDNGLRLYEKLFEQIISQNRKLTYIVGEIGFCQGELMKELSKRFFPDSAIEIKQDLSGLDRNFIIRCEP